MNRERPRRIPSAVLAYHRKISLLAAGSWFGPVLATVAVAAAPLQFTGTVPRLMQTLPGL